MDEDSKFLKQTLNLAKRGVGWTNPNPMAGALLVKNGQVIGKGYHQGLGFPHAEIEALRSCKVSPKGTTLFVNLEPCVHFGKTPPCVREIIKARIKRVICSTLDPNPKVNGQGITKLQKMGIDVSVGLLEDEAITLNEAFFTFHLKKRPFIAIKFASSLDGKIATSNGDSRWITNEKARLYARLLRGQYQAVLVGINTVLKDDPHLGVRMKGKKDPLRIILDSSLKIPLNSQVLRDNNVLVATTDLAHKDKLEKLTKKGVEIIVFKEKEQGSSTSKVPINKLISELVKREIISILVEGGGNTLGRFVDAGLVDKVYVFHAPVLIGGKKAISAIGGQGFARVSKALHLKNVSFKKFSDNMLTIGYPV